jgi:hypothetical protein
MIELHSTNSDSIVVAIAIFVLLIVKKNPLPDSIPNNWTKCANVRGSARTPVEPKMTNIFGRSVVGIKNSLVLYSTTSTVLYARNQLQVVYILTVFLKLR